MNKKKNKYKISQRSQAHLFFLNAKKPNLKKQKSLLSYTFLSTLYFTLFLTHNICQGQELSVNDAVIYLESIVNDELSKKDNIYEGNQKIDISIYENEISVKYYWENNNDVIKYEYLNSEIKFNEITFDISNISEVFTNEYKTKKTVSLKCKNGTKNCFLMENEAIKISFSKEFSDRPNTYNHYDYLHLFYLNNIKSQNKVFIALNYIIYEMKRLNGQKRDLTFNQIINQSKTNNEIIDLEKKNGVSFLTINIGGLETNAILDSGASDVSISESFEQELLSKNIINQKEYLKPGLYTIADGSVVQSNRFIIPYVKINNVLVKNVLCSVNKSKDVLLLGKSFLDRFKSWEINNESNKLILKL
ncbi:retropepsin-like aspartic protease [Flavivirga eckloniae]|uniref:Peptidase A2 domain-containing protein n=1 Tax=Flavivirga eckloniae TaxID=1803846 RepID=A0A2K9PMQ3_9FLAO|nr:retropepsin-like aspartic protease [Flavivirga eckloniae]AUP78330.1 hypothetical protein C1H87_06250 [Flavivirga eckloniae]